MSLVASGVYESPAAFLEVAVQNQIVAEEAHARSWHTAVSVSGLATPGRSPGEEMEPRASFSKGEASKVASSPMEKESIESRGAWLRQELAVPDLITAAPCAPQPELARDWPFGQVNRLFPFKLICRGLLADSAEGRWPDTQSALERLDEKARNVGKLLAYVDLEQERGRDQALATALPTEEEGSAVRFLGQFAGKRTSAGPRPGAVCTFQLASFSEETFGLTAHGIEFARLPNPLFDGEGLPTSLLSLEEQRFLVEVIRTSVPGERMALTLVLGSILRGAARFEEVLEALRPETPRQWSTLFTKTQVSGAIARAYELGLIGKQRQGRNVDYSLTPAGTAALQGFTRSTGGTDG